MKKRISLILMFVLTVCLCFVGCGVTPLTMPKNKIAQSNGGSVVKIGKTIDDENTNIVYYDYLYFANAYKASTIAESELSSDLSIYNAVRIKTANNGDIKEENSETVGIVETVAEKVSGYSKSLMFVVGDYLYFNSPNLHKNSKTNQYEFDLVCLFKVKLDGTGLKEVYKSESASVAFYLTGGDNQQLLIYDNNTIKTLNFENDKPETFVEDATSCVFPSNFGIDLKTVYFTKAREDDLSGNILCKKDLTTDSEIDEIEKETYKTSTIISYENQILIYSVAETNSTTTVKAIKNGNKQNLFTYETDTGANYSNLKYAKGYNGIDEYIVFNANSKLYVMNFADGTQNKAVTISDKEAVIRMIVDGKVIYTTSEGIFVYDLYAKTSKQISDRTDMADVFDYDGQYIYFYTKLSADGASDTKYLHRAALEITDDYEIECISKLTNSDKNLLDEE